MTKKRILITGVSGLLGSNLAFALKDRFELSGVCFRHPSVIDGVKVFREDMTQAAGVRKIIRLARPHVIIHCAAQANVDACEKDPRMAKRQNVGMNELLVDALKGKRAKLVVISTDLVYAPTPGPHDEGESLAPVNEYGRTKLLGEKAALKHKNTLVLRTNFFGWNVQDKKSLGEWVIDALSQGVRIQGFEDVYFSSLYTFDLAEALVAALSKDLKGVYNVGASDAVSKYSFACSVAKSLGLDERLISPVSIDAHGLQAKRNKDLTLNSSAFSKATGFKLPSVQQGIEHFAAHYRKGIADLIKPPVVYPKLDHIPYGRQLIDEADIAAVIETLKSSNLTQGPKVIEFEYSLAKYVGVDFCAALNSGTSALHVACLAAGVGEGDEVVTSTNTFVASANCAVYCGAKPVFTDIDRHTFNMDAADLQNKITAKTRAVIPVHFAGQSCDMKEISRIVRQKEKEFGHKIFIIEDASHATGSQYQGALVGSCNFADMTVMSFHPVKHITTCEGGAVLTKDKGLHRKICYLRSHGVTNYPEELVQSKEAFIDEDRLVRNPWYYEQRWLGYNYRITDIQCALGLSQLKKLPEFMDRRREIVDFYNKAFKGVASVKTPHEEGGGRANFHLYVLQLDFKKIGLSRGRLMNDLRGQGILTQVHYIPVHTHPFFQECFGTAWGDLPVAEAYYRRCLSVPLFPAMTLRDAQKVVDAVKKCIAG